MIASDTLHNSVTRLAQCWDRLTRPVVRWVTGLTTDVPHRCPACWHDVGAAWGRLPDALPVWHQGELRRLQACPQCQHIWLTGQDGSAQGA